MAITCETDTLTGCDYLIPSRILLFKLILYCVYKAYMEII